MPIIAIGVVITIVGVISLFGNTILGIGLILGGPLLWTNSYGIQIDPKTNKYREYGSIYGIKKGTWKPLDALPFITILKGRSGWTVYSRSNRSTVDVEDCFEVYLLNQSHRKKVLVTKMEDKTKAEAYALELAALTDKSVVRFNPVLSEKTRARR